MMIKSIEEKILLEVSKIIKLFKNNYYWVRRIYFKYNFYILFNKSYTIDNSYDDTNIKKKCENFIFSIHFLYFI